MSVAPEPTETALEYKPSLFERFTNAVKRRMGFEHQGFFPQNLEQHDIEYTFADTYAQLPWKIRLLVFLTGRLEVHQRFHEHGAGGLFLAIETQIYVPWDKR